MTPQQAERAAVAERLGKITLAIRAVERVAEATGHRSSVYGGDVSAALAEGGGTSGAPRMRVIEGKDAREVTFQ